MLFNGNFFENNDDKIKSFTIEQKHFNNGSTRHKIGSSLKHCQINVKINENRVSFVKIYKLDSPLKINVKIYEVKKLKIDFPSKTFIFHYKKP